MLTAARAAGIGARVVFNQQTPMSAFLADARLPLAAAVASARVFGRDARSATRLADAIVTTSKGVADDLVAQFGVARRAHSRRPQSGRSRGDRARPQRAARSAQLERAVDASGDRRGRPAGRREELSAADRRARRSPAAACRRACSSSAQGERESGAARADRADSASSDAVVLCGFQRESLEVHRARRRVRADARATKGSATCWSRRWRAACRSSRPARRGRARS